MKTEELKQILISTGLAVGRLYEQMETKGYANTTKDDWMMLGIFIKQVGKDAKTLADAESKLKQKGKVA